MDVWAAIVIAGFVTNDTTVRRTVDVIELNHFYDDQACLVFDQWIFWKWYKRLFWYKWLLWYLWLFRHLWLLW